MGLDQGMTASHCHKSITLSLLVMVILLSFYLRVSAAPVVPNTAVITGVVFEYGIVSARLLGIQPEQTIYKITIHLESSEDVPGTPNLLKGKKGQDITFLTKEQLSSDIFGKKIRAEVSYVGDERGGRWWLRTAKVLE